MKKRLSPIYRERRTLLSGAHLWKLYAWTRAYYVELEEQGRVVLLYAGVDCSQDDFDLSWVGDDGENRETQVIAVTSKDAAIRLAVEDASAFLLWAWLRLEHIPAALVPRAAKLEAAPRDGGNRRIQIEAHLREAWESFAADEEADSIANADAASKLVRTLEGGGK